MTSNEQAVIRASKLSLHDNYSFWNIKKDLNVSSKDLFLMECDKLTDSHL
jgi:hypothetical protein